MSHAVDPLVLPGLAACSPTKTKQRIPYRTPIKKRERNTFPTTPRSVEKQKNMIGTRLKRLMENHLRLTATNKMLNGMNKTSLDHAVVSNSYMFLSHQCIVVKNAEVTCHSQQALVSKAQHEKIFQEARINIRRQYVDKIDQRDLAQEKNIRGLVRYSKKITAELEEYKQKVEMSEQVVRDLRQTGNDSVNSLFSMLKRYKRQARNTQEEIDKLQSLMIFKDNEITGLNQEITALSDMRVNMDTKYKRKSEQAKKMIDENKAVIKRQDKLIVDLQQKNEVCQIGIAQTEQEVLKRYNERTALQVRLKELEDNRKQLSTNIDVMNGKINEFNSYTVYQMQREREMAKEQKAEQKRLAEEAKALAGRRGLRAQSQQDSGSPLKSAMSKKPHGRSGSLKEGK